MVHFLVQISAKNGPVEIEKTSKNGPNLKEFSEKLLDEPRKNSMRYPECILGGTPKELLEENLKELSEGIPGRMPKDLLVELQNIF